MYTAYELFGFLELESEKGPKLDSLSKIWLNFGFKKVVY